MRGSWWVWGVGFVSVASVAPGCSGRAETDGFAAGGATSGAGGNAAAESTGGRSAAGGSSGSQASGGKTSGAGGSGPLAGIGGNATAGGGATANGGQGGGSTGGASSPGTGVETAMGGAADGESCASSECSECSPDLEQCVSGSCQASDAVREETVMVHIPGGTFLMGNDAWGPSSPVHEQTVLDFSMDKTEVTARAYDLCVQAGACAAPAGTGAGANFRVPGFEDYPINFVTLRQAETYCAWMGKRLPTEAEWEYAAGGRQGFEYPWGENTPAGCITGFVNPNPEDFDFEHGCAVGLYSANANGLLDMGGSMYEFTQSPWCPYSTETTTGYAADCQSDAFAKRDGGFTANESTYARVAFREPVTPDAVYASFGFRCAMESD